VNPLSRRRYIILGIFAVVAAIFIIRLFHLQVLSPVYKQSATDQVLRRITQYPSRGQILDRKGKLLVFEKPAYDIMATPREMVDFDTLRFARLVEVDKDELVARIKAAWVNSSYKPSPIVKQITPERYAYIQEQLFKFNGISTQTRTVREYPRKIASHLLGYVGEVSPDMMNEDSYYQMGDYVGISGIERSYETELRGEKGVKFLLVDAQNRVKGSYQDGVNDLPAVTGKSLVTTIDADLQEYAEKLMRNKKGAIVAIEPATGEILAILSAPGYDPNLLVGRDRGNNFAKLQADSLQPIFNRALMGRYPPGSTFKMAQALVGLQQGTLTPSTTYHCAAGYHVGGFDMRCHHNGDFDLTGAIANSCNAYFANVFKATLDNPRYKNDREAYDTWRQYMLDFGFGRKLDTDLYNELKGSVPTSDYYEENTFKGSRWRALPIISLAIGQGELDITPLQMANYTAILANRGHYFIPHIVKKIEGQDTIDARFTIPIQTRIDKQHYEEVITGMAAVFEGGTGSRSKIQGIEQCGKTGTAQNPHGANHSVFVDFAPRYNPQIAIAVYVENGIEGALYAGPIASLMVEKYLNDTISAARKPFESAIILDDVNHK
jgi:penicillin-binding protein 2